VWVPLGQKDKQRSGFVHVEWIENANNAVDWFVLYGTKRQAKYSMCLSWMQQKSKECIRCVCLGCNGKASKRSRLFCVVLDENKYSVSNEILFICAEMLMHGMDFFVHEL